MLHPARGAHTGFRTALAGRWIPGTSPGMTTMTQDLSALETRASRRDRRRRRSCSHRARAHCRARPQGPHPRADGAAGLAASRAAQGLRPGRQRPQDARRRGARCPQGRPRARGALRPARHRAGRHHAARPARPSAGRPHPSRQPGVRRGRRDIRRHGLCHRRRARHRDRRPQLHQAQHPARAPRPAGARHLLHEALAGTRATTPPSRCCARTRAPCRSAP